MGPNSSPLSESEGTLEVSHWIYERFIPQEAFQSEKLPGRDLKIELECLGSRSVDSTDRMGVGGILRPSTETPMILFNLI